MSDSKDRFFRIFRQGMRPRRSGPAHAALHELVKSLESNQPVPQKARVHLLFGLTDYLSQDGRVPLDLCLGLRGRRNALMMRDRALAAMGDELGAMPTLTKCQVIQGVIEQAQRSDPAADEPEIMRLARIVIESGAKVDLTDRRLTDILEARR